MHWVDIPLGNHLQRDGYGLLICVLYTDPISQVQNGKRSGRKRKHGTWQFGFCSYIPTKLWFSTIWYWTLLYIWCPWESSLPVTPVGNQRIVTHGLYTILHNLIIVDFLRCLELLIPRIVGLCFAYRSIIAPNELDSNWEGYPESHFHWLFSGEISHYRIRICTHILTSLIIIKFPNNKIQLFLQSII